eukprot:sb/3472248/
MRGTSECIEECLRLRFSAFEKYMSFYSGEGVSPSENIIPQTIVEPEEIPDSDSEIEGEYEGDGLGQSDPAGSSMEITTSLGTMHIARAERLFLNQGGVKNQVKGRASRITKRHIFTENTFVSYCQGKSCCGKAIIKGDTAKDPAIRPEKTIVIVNNNIFGAWQGPPTRI